MNHQTCIMLRFVLIQGLLSLAVGCAQPQSSGVWLGAPEVGSSRAAVPTGTTTFSPTEKTTGLVRNPGMGWILYLDACGSQVSNKAPNYTKGVFYPDLFWQSFDQSGATAKASIFYIRAPWSFFEPTKGNYAWKNSNSAESKLIKGALDRGLKLAFRVNTDSQDSWQQATPQYVRDDGAKGYMNNGWDASDKSIPLWTPYGNDAVFLARFQTFIAAFGLQYNDPSVVDFIDGLGLGWWGECHAITFDSGQTKANLASVLDTVTSAYKAAFPGVLLGAQQGGSAISYSDALVKSRNFDVLRRDSFGMPQWFSASDKAYYADMVINQGTPVFAENGWNNFGNGNFQNYMNNNGNPFSKIRDMLVYSLQDAKTARANTFDLRVPADAIEWMNNSDLVDDFVVNGGYRLVPKSFTIPKGIGSASPITVLSTWKNTGLGIVPNRRPEWNGKYRVAYALVPAGASTPAQTVVTTIDPAAWLKGSDYQYSTRISFGKVPDGNYTLAYAIVDTSHGNLPALNIAVTNQRLSTGWYAIGTTTVAGIASTSPWAEPSNIAPASTLASSWGTGSGTLGALVDGNPVSAWGSVRGISFPGYLTLNFGDSSLTADGLTLVSHYGQSQGITNFDVEVFNGTAWVPIVTNQSVAWNANTNSEEYRFVPFPATAAQKFRFKVNAANSQWNLVALNELQLWGAMNLTLTNVAPRASVTTSMATGTGSVAALTDNNLTYAWGSSVGQSLPGTITLDWGATAVSTSKVTLATLYGVGAGVTNLDIESFNGTAWIPVVTNYSLSWMRNSTDVEYRDVVFPEVTTSKLRIRVNASNRQWNKTAINELQVWGN
jgi:hypothetical protein